MINFLELIYPNVCGFCNKICKENICIKCMYQLKQYKIDEKYVKKHFDGIGIYRYKDIIRTKFIDYKFNNKPYLYKTFAEIILNDKKICGILKKYDIIIPVPISKKRKQKRGYNQTALIAKYIAKKTNLKYENNVLIKLKNISSQSELNKNDRIKNVKNAFGIKNEEKIKGKNIILFDDIYTTGSTVSECSNVLKKAKVNNIFVLTFAKD